MLWLPLPLHDSCRVRAAHVCQGGGVEWSGMYMAASSCCVFSLDCTCDNNRLSRYECADRACGAVQSCAAAADGVSHNRGRHHSLFCHRCVDG